MKRQQLSIIACGIAVSLSLPQGTSADTYFPADATIDTNTTPGGDVIVGYANVLDQVAGTNGTSPTVTVVPGGVIGNTGAFNGSTVKVEGGDIHITGILNALDHATVSLSSGGSVTGGSLRSFGQGRVTMSGGSIGSVVALENSTLDVSGGSILARVDVKNGATGGVSGVTIGRMTGGQFVEGEVNTHDTSKLELGTVTVGLNVKARNSSEIKMTSATVVGGVEGRDTTTLMISGGSVGGSVFGYNLNMIGGTVAGGVGIGGTGAVGTVDGTQVGGSLSVGGAGASLSATGGTIGGGASAGGGTTLSLSNLQIGSGINGFNSTISASGTEINGDVSIQASASLSEATINASEVAGNLTTTGGLSAIRNATITITGSNITGNVQANDRSAITLVSTSVGTDVTANSGSGIGSLIDIQGSTVSGDALSKNSGAQVRLAGGTIMGNLTATDRAAVTILDGTVQGNFALTGRSSGTMNGGNVAGKADLDAITFTMTGGNIAKDVTVKEFSQFNMSNGSLGGELVVSGEAATIMTGGAIAQDVSVKERSRFDMSNGMLGGALVGSGEARTSMTGGIIAGSVDAEGVSAVDISGGTVNSSVSASALAAVTVRGGQVNEGIVGFDAGRITMSGGRAQFLMTHDSSIINMSGGSNDTIAFVFGSSILNLSGTALIGGEVQAFSQATVNFSGGGVKAASMSDDAQLDLSGSGVIAEDLQLNQFSKADISGGTIGGNVEVLDNSTLNITGSAFIAGDVNSQGRINMSGGNVGGNVNVAIDGRLIIDGGTVAGKIIGTGTGAISMLGGTAGGIEAKGDILTTILSGQILGDAISIDQSGIIMIAGTVSGQLEAQKRSTIQLEGSAAVAGVAGAREFSTFFMRGGTVGVGISPADLVAAENATVNLSGGTVGGNLSGFDSATINMSGGTVFGRGVFRTARFNFSGGNILGGVSQSPGLRAPRGGGQQSLAITASDGATISIFGGGLVATLVDPDADGMSKYQLTGRLADGTVIDGGFLFVQNGTQTSHELRAGGNWRTDGGGTWGLTANWASNVIPAGPGALAQFPDVITAPNSPAGINLDGDRTLGSIRFNSANAYVIQPGSGGSLTLDNTGSPADITVESGHHRIAVPVSALDDTTALIVGGASLSLTEGITLAAGKTLTATGDGELSAAFVSGGMLNIEAGVTRILPDIGTDFTTSSVTVGANGTLGGTGPFSAAITVNGRLAPGDSVGTMTSNSTVTFGPGSGYNFGIADWNGVAGTGYDTLTANSIAITATAANPLTVYVDGGGLANFSEGPRTFTLASAAALTGLTAANWAVSTTNFSGTGAWSVRVTGNNLELTYSPPGYAFWIAEFPGVDPSPTADSDGDTFVHLLEYVLGGNPSLAGEPIAPVIARTGTDSTFTFRRTDRSEGDTIVTVRYSTDLAGPWTEVPIGAVSGGNVSIAENGAGPDTVMVTITAPGPRLFAQLLITKNP
jgi:fibronectin-binding autotransporter adhesin